MTLVANSNTRYVIRVDLNDDWAGMEISIMARRFANDDWQYEF